MPPVTAAGAAAKCLGFRVQAVMPVTAADAATELFCTQYTDVQLPAEALYELYAD